MPEIQQLNLDAIRIDGTQTRAALDEATVAEYAECYRNRAKMPPLVVFFDGSEHWLAEGFHRYFALRKIKHDKPVRCDVREGTRRDAIQFGFTANVAHGLRRTNADKRHAVEMALSDPEWENWTDHAISDLCGVDHKTVAKVRSERQSVGEIPQLPGAQPQADSGVSETPSPKSRTGKDGKKYPAKQPKTTKKSEPATEESGGTDAPPADENPAGWAEATETCAGVERLLREAISALESFEATPASVWLPRVSGKSQIRIALEKARNEMFTSRPSERCGKCESGCDHCRKSGWLPKYMTTKNAKSTRAE